MMTDAELLAKVKAGLGITTDYQDETLRIYIDDAKGFLLRAGVKEAVVNSSASVGCILGIVTDTWNYGSGGIKLSQYTQQRIIQLAAEVGANV